MKRYLTSLAICLLLLWNITAHALSSSGYVKVTDANLYYQKSGQGTPVIVLHGGPGLDSSYLLPQMEKIGKQHQVVFYDQRGSGKSIAGSLDAKYFNLDQFVQDLEQLRQTLGYNKIVLIGHSWGGMLAMAYAIKYPQHMSALVLMNSEPSTSEGFTAFAKKYEKRVKPISKKIEAIVKSPPFTQGNQQTFDRYCRLIFKTYLYNKDDVNKLSLAFSSLTAKNQLKIGAFFSKGLFEKPYDLRKELNKLNIPTLVIHGEADPIPLWTAEQTTSAIPNAQLIVIKKSGHFSYAENEKGVFTAITDFINSH
jgi:proline iminopeptidase